MRSLRQYEVRWDCKLIKEYEPGEGNYAPCKAVHQFIAVTAPVLAIPPANTSELLPHFIRVKQH